MTSKSRLSNTTGPSPLNWEELLADCPLCGSQYECSRAKGAVIFRENDKAKYLYTIRQGRIKLVKRSAAAEEIILEILRAGEPMGLVPAFDGRPYPATAIAMTDVRLFRIPREHFMEMLRRDATLAENIIADLAGRLRESWNLKALFTQQAEERIIRLLDKLAQRFGKETDSGILIDLPLTRRDLAEFAGTTIETAIRVISSLRKQGLLLQSGRRLVVADHSRLLKRLPDGPSQDKAGPR